MVIDSTRLDVASTLFGDGRRRRTLAVLSDLDGDASLRDVAAELAARERGVRAVDVPDSAVSEVHVSLYHVHVPILADAGIVEYDRGPDRVELVGPTARETPSGANRARRSRLARR